MIVRTLVEIPPARVIPGLAKEVDRKARIGVLETQAVSSRRRLGFVIEEGEVGVGPVVRRSSPTNSRCMKRSGVSSITTLLNWRPC